MDYLTNLLDGAAYDRAAAIQPLRAPLFAPAPYPSSATGADYGQHAADGQSNDNEGNSEAASARRPSAPRPQPRDTAHQQANITSPPAPSIHETRHTAHPAALTTLWPGTADSYSPSLLAHTEAFPVDTSVARTTMHEAGFTPHPVETIRTSKAVPAAQPVEELLLAKLRALLPTGPAITARSDEGAAPSPLRAVVVDAPTQPMMQMIKRHDRAHQSNHRSDDALSPQPLPPPPLTLIQPRRQALPPLPAPPLLSSAVPAPPAAPTIQVTIGRVEVRVASAAPPPRQPAAGPRLTLEAYLQQRDGRNGGGR